MLLPSGQNMNAANLHVLSNVAEAPQALLEPVQQVRSGGSLRQAEEGRGRLEAGWRQAVADSSESSRSRVQRRTSATDRMLMSFPVFAGTAVGV